MGLQYQMDTISQTPDSMANNAGPPPPVASATWPSASIRSPRRDANDRLAVPSLGTGRSRSEPDCHRADGIERESKTRIRDGENRRNARVTTFQDQDDADPNNESLCWANGTAEFAGAGRFTPAMGSLRSVRSISRQVIPQMPRQQTFQRQQSEKRDNLEPLPASLAERRTLSEDRRPQSLQQLSLRSSAPDMAAEYRQPSCRRRRVMQEDISEVGQGDEQIGEGRPGDEQIAGGRPGDGQIDQGQPGDEQIDDGQPVYQNQTRDDGYRDGAHPRNQRIPDMDQGQPRDPGDGVQQRDDEYPVDEVDLRNSRQPFPLGHNMLNHGISYGCNDYAGMDLVGAPLNFDSVLNIEDEPADVHMTADEQLEANIKEELEKRWILNLSMHFRDNSRREKFFVTYLQPDGPSRRVTISIDYRNAPEDSLERELSETNYQREKSTKIYETIRDSLSQIEFFNTVTNLKLETTDGRLHVHVMEDTNEVIRYPNIRQLQHLNCPKVRESDVVFESHMSGFVYKVNVGGRTLIKKEIPGPDTIEEFMYEIQALSRLQESENVIDFYGIVVDDCEEVIKGLLITYADGGALVDAIFEHSGSEMTHIPWPIRSRWASQIIHGVADIHESGFVQGDLTLANIVIDEKKNAKIIDINRRGCPLGWEAPESKPLLESGQRLSMHIGVKSDLYQLGMVLWALAVHNDEPEREREERPLELPSDDLDIPPWYRRIVERCLDPEPRRRLNASQMLSWIPAQERKGHQKWSSRNGSLGLMGSVGLGTPHAPTAPPSVTSGGRGRQIGIGKRSSRSGFGSECTYASDVTGSDYNNSYDGGDDKETSEQDMVADMVRQEGIAGGGGGYRHWSGFLPQDVDSYEVPLDGYESSYPPQFLNQLSPEELSGFDSIVYGRGGSLTSHISDSFVPDELPDGDLAINDLVRGLRVDDDLLDGGLRIDDSGPPLYQRLHSMPTSDLLVEEVLVGPDSWPPSSSIARSAGVAEPPEPSLVPPFDPISLWINTLEPGTSIDLPHLGKQSPFDPDSTMPAQATSGDSTPTHDPAYTASVPPHHSTIGHHALSSLGADPRSLGKLYSDPGDFAHRAQSTRHICEARSREFGEVNMATPVGVLFGPGGR